MNRLIPYLSLALVVMVRSSEVAAASALGPSPCTFYVSTGAIECENIVSWTVACEGDVLDECGEDFWVQTATCQNHLITCQAVDS